MKYGIVKLWFLFIGLFPFHINSRPLLPNNFGFDRFKAEFKFQKNFIRQLR